MAFRSEAELWAEERRKVASKQTARGRAFIRWFAPAPVPEVDHFVWRDPFAAAPEIEDAAIMGKAS